MSTGSARTSFANRLIAWQRRSGRHDLPWQDSRDPYRVWLSEVMLQQTQVTAVIPYFLRFVHRFPSVQDLALADLDGVLALWSGLGYYGRARNLHKCARVITQQFGGRFPDSAESLEQLPGIGRTTAAAIASICFGQRVSILDANARRVVTRYLGFPANEMGATGTAHLWAAAEQLLPIGAGAAKRMPAYTQGLMDLGAKVCKTRQPQCARCPMRQDCATHQHDTRPILGTARPVRLARTARAIHHWWLLWLRAPGGLVWLERRPEQGIWGGLFCMPCFADASSLRTAVPEAGRRHLHERDALVHRLTHVDLHLHPVGVHLKQRPLRWPPEGAQSGAWYATGDLAALGLPAPIRTLLDTG